MAAQQYQKLAEFEGTFWAPGSPVVMEKMRLCYDRLYGANVLQITFRNVAPINMYGLSIRVTLKDEKGREIYQDVPYNYYGMEVPSCRSFGATDDIIVEPEAVAFDVTVLRGDLADGRYVQPDVKLQKMPPERPTEALGAFEQPFLDKVQQLRPKLKVLCAPEDKEDYWRCVCKRIYPRAITKCPTCRLNAQDLLGIVPELRAEQRRRELEAARLEKERLAAERRREEERLAEEERARLEAERLAEQQRLAAERLAEQQRLEIERMEAQRKLAEEQRLAREEAERQAKKARMKRALRIAVPVCCVALVVALLLLLPRRDDVPPVEQPPVDAVDPDATPDTPPVVIEPVTNDQPILLVQGADASEAEAKTIWRLFGIRKIFLGKHETVSVTQDQQQMLRPIVGLRNLEDRAVSSVLIRPAAPGTGLQIALYNIDYCTEDMFRAVLVDLGITDANVVVAAPEPVSGTAALAGLAAMTDHSADYVGKGIGTGVAKANMYVRSGPSTTFGTYGDIPVGGTVEVLEEDANGWYKIVWEDSLYGYAYTCNTAGAYYTFTPAS